MIETHRFWISMVGLDLTNHAAIYERLLEVISIFDYVREQGPLGLGIVDEFHAPGGDDAN